MEEAEYSGMCFENEAKKTVGRALKEAPSGCSDQRFGLPVDCTGCGGIPNTPIIARTARIWTPSRVW
jgi:hypothetical protein